MRNSFIPNDYLPSAIRDGDDSSRTSQQGAAPNFHDLTNSPITKWEAPWLAVGQAEPGWWRAFAIDHGVRSTRTPDKFIRKPEETNVFDLPTGEPLPADRLAEVVMNKPEEEIHRRIERLRAAIEAPPVRMFVPKPQSAVPPPHGRGAETPGPDAPRQAEPPSELPARDVERSSTEAVEPVSLPSAESPMSTVPIPSTMFVPSAFQSALYRIDVSLKHPLAVRADGIPGHTRVAQPAPAAIPLEAGRSEAIAADLIAIEADSPLEVLEDAAAFPEVQHRDGSITAPAWEGTANDCDDRADTGLDDARERAQPAGAAAALAVLAMRPSVDGATAVKPDVTGMSPEATGAPTDDVDLAYLALYGEDVALIHDGSGISARGAAPCAPAAPAPVATAEAQAPAAVADAAATDDDPAPAGGWSEPVREENAGLTTVPSAAAIAVVDGGRPADGMPAAQEKAVAAPAAPEAAPLAATAAPQRVKVASYQLPDIGLLGQPPESEGPLLTEDILEERAGRVEKVIRDFGVKGEVIHVHPGPVVTLYELEPAPGVKSSRVIALSDDIARSMSSVSARVAVIPGRNAIGIELPNDTRETVYLRELLETADFRASTQKLPLCLGKTIGGEPVIADLARMPHLLVAGTTGSGKSVAINTMILSLVYRFTPEQCRLIMVDPKMLELSVYDGIPHLLTPVVTDPKKAIIALRWAVREMEDRYRKMSKLGVRNIDGFNARVSDARAKGEVIKRTVQTGFDKNTGELTYTEEVMDLEPLPYIVVIVDEMADLMMVAGKDIEGAIQRLAQMARAAGIHVILATQRPSVDVITGTIKANFPTRISFQVTSKIDSRTILGEMGAEQLLGQGDMLYMAGGGRITRVHGPFCSDEEVEKVVAHLKRQGEPQYLEAVTADDEEPEEGETLELPMEEDDVGLASADVYEQAVQIVLRHRKASTSYIQRRLQIGYNRAASLMERMEQEGIVGPANHAGKRDILRGEFER